MPDNPSCNMCRKGKTALGRDCPNGCNDPWVIIKNGMYYRPDSAGYTGSILDAGRFTQFYAKRHAENVPEVTVMRLADAPEFSGRCSDEKKLQVIQAENERLRAENAALWSRVKRWEPGADPATWGTGAVKYES
jgi:hypothetical protein